MRHFNYITALLVLGAAFACGKEPDDQTAGIRLSVEPDVYTKGAEFSEDQLSENAKLYVAGTLRDPQGRISTPSTFLSGNDPATAKLEHDSGRIWKFPDGKSVILPLGGYTFNALAYGADVDSGTVPDCWNPTLVAADAASGMTFSNVDTYTTQVDMMYGAANGISAANPQGTLTLLHAQAMLIFNIKFTGEGTAFIIANGSVPKFALNDILFVNNAGLLQYLNGQTVTAANIPLKTKGTFRVNNSLTTLSADWSSLEAQDNKYAVNMAGATDQKRSKSNLDSVQEKILHSGNWAQNLSWGVLYQVGNPLLVPEQPSLGFWVVYTYEGARYNTYVPIPEGTWKGGEKYIYNLEINRVGGAITLRTAGHEIGGEYNPDNIDTNWD